MAEPTLFDEASLALIASGGAGKDGKVYSVKPTDGTGDFTFSRGSNLAATRVGPTGLIEKGRENLLLQSNQFDTTWVSVTASVTSGQSGYDGSSDAWLLSKSAASGRIYQNASVSGVATYSVYAKSNDLDWLFIIGTASSYPEAYFNLSNGTIGNTSNHQNFIGANIEDVGNGWYRCSITFNDLLGQFRIYPADGNNDFSGSSGSIYIQDAQLEIGLAATEIITTGATTGKAGLLEDEPRFDYSGGATCPSLLLEPSRTNIVPISEGIPEDTNGVTLTENYGTSPEGLQNSLKVQKDGVSSNDRIFPIDNYNATLVSGTSYSLSAFVKNIDVNGTTTIGCRLGSGGTLFRLGYEWNGSSLTKSTLYAAGTRTNEILEDYGNGWWRIGFSFVADNTQGGIELDIDRQNGSATTSIETYGWQLEAGSYPTSYIPNHSGGSVTRGADVCGDAGDANTFNDSEGVLYAEISALADDGTYRILSINDGTRNERVYMQYTSTTNQISVVVKNANTTQANIPFTLSDETQYAKVAVRYKANDFALYINGSQIGTDTSGSTPVGLNNFSFDQGNGANNFYGNVKQVLYFPTALTDSECIALTTL